MGEENAPEKPPNKPLSTDLLYQLRRHTISLLGGWMEEPLRSGSWVRGGAPAFGWNRRLLD